jgi:lysophospholipase L1-like esterase
MLNRWLADYAAASDAIYLDYHGAMVDGRGLLKDELTDDGLHPNAEGYKVMASLAERAIERALEKR